SEIMQIFSKCPAGYFIEPENVEVFSGTILRFLQEYNNYEIGRQAREFVSKNFDRRIQAQKIIDIIEDRII
ncbi:MAG: hypothetical protein OQK64_04235, partial [Ignavibacteriaceae bacterium]|nr:hypothetical protein [Ignavibacteriaceae bacterium]